MNPIISPWLIWLSQLSDGIKLASIIAGTLLAGACAVVAVTILALRYNDWDGDEEDKIKALKPPCKIFAILAAILFGISIIIPSQSTIKQMIVANYITNDNISKVVEGSRETIDYIFDKIEDLSNGGHNEAD